MFKIAVAIFNEVFRSARPGVVWDTPAYRAAEDAKAARTLRVRTDSERAMDEFRAAAQAEADRSGSSDTILGFPSWLAIPVIVICVIKILSLH